MGIETIVAIAAVAASAASTGYQVSESRDAARQGKDARRDEANMLAKRTQQLDQAQSQNDVTAAARLARLRQRAILGTKDGYDQTIATSPLGLSQTQAASGPTGPQPLKKLGA